VISIEFVSFEVQEQETKSSFYKKKKKSRPIFKYDIFKIIFSSSEPEASLSLSSTSISSAPVITEKTL
jgi:hypothetical protein